MKIDRSKVKKCSSEMPADCKALIDKLKSCTQQELYIELKKIKIWKCGKCELYHWIDVLDLFDSILEEACHRSKKTQWTLPCDMPGFEDKKLLLFQILHFTALLIEHSFSRHLYNSMEHLTTLLSSCDMQVVLGVLSLLYVFSKRSNFITRLSGTRRQALLSRLTFLAESWGGKDNGFGLAQCCQDLPITSFPSSATTVHFEFYDTKSKENKLHLPPTYIHLEKVDQMTVSSSSQISPSSAAEIMEHLIEKYAVPEEKLMLLFTHARLAHSFSNFTKRSQSVQARLTALSILVYSNALQENSNSLLYNGLIDELVDILELKDPDLIEIKAASLRTLTSIIHLERNPRLNAIIDATGASSYHGFLPVLVRNCIQALTNPSLPQFPLPFATALFSCLYHLASYEAGAEALVSCGMMESLLKVVKWPSTEPEHITFVTRAVRVIDLITNLDMAAFQTHGGLIVFINRLEMEVDVCRKEQPFVIRTRGRNSSSSSYIEGQASSSQSGLNAIPESSVSPMEVDIVTQSADSPEMFVVNACVVGEVKQVDNVVPRSSLQCLPQRAALLKSMLNFLKKAFQDPTFSDSIRHVMDGPLPGALKHVISNAEYYGPSLFLLATDVVTVYVFQEPSLLSSLQDSGLTDVVLQALLVKDVPAAREVLASLPNVFSALCLNSRGLQAFVACKPFERLFKVLLSPDYLQAMRRRRSSDPMGDTATNLGNAVDELMRHQPSLKSDATAAIIKLLEELCTLGSDPKYICIRPTTSAKVETGTTSDSAASSRQNSSNSRTANEGTSSDDEDDEDEESSTTSAILKNGAGEASASEDKNITDGINSDSSRTPVPLVDYVMNVMKFVDAILSNNSTDDHCREFVSQKGLVPLMNILSLPNLPIDFPVTPACQAVAAVSKSILNLAHEPNVLRHGLVCLHRVLASLEPLHEPPATSCSTILLSELANVAPNNITETTANAYTTPLLHAMSAAHSIIMMFVHVCRTGQADIRSISVNHWGSLIGLKVLKGLSKLYTTLVWESTILLALCNGQSLPCNCEQHGKVHQLENLIPSLITASAESAANKTAGEMASTSVTTAMEALSTDSPSNAPMEVDELVETFSGDKKALKTKLTLSQQAQIKQIKPLLSGSSRLGRALAELFGLLVKLCVGVPIRQRRGQHVSTTPSMPQPASQAVASALTKLLANSLSWEPPVSFPSAYLRMTFFICSIGFTSPMLFDEKKFPYHLMLQKFLSSGGQEAFFEIFRRVPEVTYEDLEKKDVCVWSGIGEFLDAWLMLLEKMVNPKTVLESPHVLPSKSTLPDYIAFNPTLYLIHTHKQAFEAVSKLWERKPMKIYGARMSESLLTILCHIIKGEATIKERLSKEKESTTDDSAASSSNNTRRRRFEEPEVNPEHLQQLVDMGFPHEQATDALYHSTTIEQATDFLLLNPVPAMSLTHRPPQQKDEEEKSKEEVKVNQEDEKQVEEEPLDVDIVDQFTATRLIPGCMKLLDSLPDTVYRVCDLLVAVVQRNGPQWRDKMVNNLLTDVNAKLEALNLNSAKENNTSWPNSDPLSNEVAVRLHLVTLLFEELKSKCAPLIKKANLIEQAIATLVNTEKAMNANKDVTTPKYLAPILLIIDLCEKISVASTRRACMLTLTSHTWKWFDDRSVRWSVYNASNNKTIDDAFRAGESSVYFTAGRRKYSIQFSSMVQISEETSNRRPVMLTLKSKNDKNKENKQKGKEVSGETGTSSNAMETDDPTSEIPNSSKTITPPEIMSIIPGISTYQIDTLLGVCVSFIRVPVDPDTLHAVMRLCLRLTRDHKYATKFAELGGIKLLIGLTQASSFTGFTSLATLLIRHVLDDIKSLKTIVERTIQYITSPAINTAGSNKEMHFLFRILSPTICRNPEVFTDVARSILRIALPPPKRGDDDLETRFTGPNAVPFLKSLPVKAPGAVNHLNQTMEEVISDLLNVLIIKVNYEQDDSTSSVSTASASSGETPTPSRNVFSVPAQPSQGSAPHISRNSSANDLLQEDEDVSQSMDTTNDQSESTKKSPKKDSASDESSKKNSPLIPKSSVCRLIAELIRSYSGCTKFISEFTYSSNQSELITEECTALSFILDHLAPSCQTVGDKDTSSLARILVASLSSANHCPEAQSTLVSEVKTTLAKALSMPESNDKHLRIQSIMQIINTMIECCPAPNTSPAVFSVKPGGMVMNNIVKLMVKKGLVGDLAKIPHSLDLSSPSLATTINGILKPLEGLSRIINIPHPVPAKNAKSKSAPTSSADAPPQLPSANVVSSSVPVVATGTTRADSEDNSQAGNTVATESENTNTQDDNTTEDATENDGLDLSIPISSSAIEQSHDDSGEELDEIMDQLLERAPGRSGSEAVRDMLINFESTGERGDSSQDDDRDQIIIAMDSDIRMDDHSSQMLSQNDSVYETVNDDHHRESESDSDSDHSDDDHEEDDGDDNDDDDDDDDEDEEADDDFNEWDDQLFRVTDQNDDFLIQFDDVLPSTTRDYSLLFRNISDNGSNLRNIPLNFQEEAATNTDSTQTLPPPPGMVSTNHPLLVRHADPHNAITCRFYRNGRQRGYRMAASNVVCDDFRYMASEGELFELAEQQAFITNAMSVIPSASIRWAEESRVLDSDSIHDCVTSVKPEIIEVLEHHRDLEIVDRKEKKRKQQEEDEAKKQKNKSNAEKETEQNAPKAANTTVDLCDVVSNPNIQEVELTTSENRSSTPRSSSQLDMDAMNALASSIVDEVLGSSTFLSRAMPGVPITASANLTTSSETVPASQTPIATAAPSASAEVSTVSAVQPQAPTTTQYSPFLEYLAQPTQTSDVTSSRMQVTIRNVVSGLTSNQNNASIPVTTTPVTLTQETDSTIRVSTSVSETTPTSVEEVQNEIIPIREENTAQSTSNNASNSNAAESSQEDVEVPEGVDPSFLAALPDSIREEVIAEQLRLQRLRQNVTTAAQPSSTTTTPTTTIAPIPTPTATASSTDSSFTEVSPEFLAALPPSIQEEVLQQQRQEQQRLASQNTNPEAPVDPVGFIQTLPPGLRQQVLADMDDSLVALLPSELATEAQSLRHEVEARQRQITERFFSHNSSTLSNILRTTGRLTNRHGMYAVPQPHLAWAISQSVSGSSRTPAPGTFSTKARGKQLLDHEALTCLLVLLFVDEPRLNTSRLHRLLRNLSYHIPTRDWIIKSLLDIMSKTELSKLPSTGLFAHPDGIKGGGSKSKSSKSQDNSSKLSCDTLLRMQPSWLSIGLDAALGCRATVFQMQRSNSLSSHSKGKSSSHQSRSSSSQSITVHPQASTIICRHVLDTLISLAKSFPTHFLPYNYREGSNKTNQKGKTINRTSKSGSSLENRTNFWDILLKLDAISTSANSQKSKGKSLLRPHGGANVASCGLFEDDKGESIPFEMSPLGLLIKMLSHPVIKRSSLLTDRLLRLLALISMGLPEDSSNSNSKSKQTSDNSSSTTDATRDNSTKKPANCDTEIQMEDMETEEEKRLEKESIEQHLGITVDVLTSKSCSEEGLEDATALLVQLSRSCGLITRDSVLKLLLEGGSKLGEVVRSHIHTLMIELQKMNVTKTKSDKETPNSDSHEASASDPSRSSIGIWSDRFTSHPVVVNAPTNIKAARELQIPAMTTLTSKTSSQAFFLRVLKVILQLQQAHKLDIKKPKQRSSLMSLLSIEEVLGMITGHSTSRRENQSSSAAQPQQPARTSNPSSDERVQEETNEENEDSSLITPMEVDPSTQSANALKKDIPRLSQDLQLDDLWKTLSDCLMELAETPDHHAVLVLQPSVEAFFLVHASSAEREMSNSASKQETQENQMAHLHLDIAPLSPLPSSGETSKDNPSTSRQNSAVSIPSTLPPDTQKFLKFAELHRTVLNQILRQSTAHLADGPFSVLVDHTRVLDFDVKRRYFRQELERTDEGLRREDLAIHVRREHVFEDSYRELHRRSTEEWKNRFYIVFEGEEGQDAGGLLREWYMIVSREIFNPMYALFTTSPGDRVTYMINPSSHCNSNHLSYFKFVGRVIAKAIYDNKLLECYFTRSFYNHILGRPVKHTDMESEDYSFYQGLAFLLDNDVKSLGYDLTFSTEVQEFGVTEVRDLKPDGRNLLVSEESKQEYVRLVCQMKMMGAIRKQLNSFLEGFYDIIPKRLISIFNEQELELLISGLPVIDIDDLKANTEYHKYQTNSLQIQWFWRALRSFDQADRAKFLQFVTGTSKVPLQGFSALEGMNGTQKFQIHRDDRSTVRLPSAHTCFNQLDLPAYETYDKLKVQLLMAVHECSEGFGFA